MSSQSTRVGKDNLYLQRENYADRTLAIEPGGTEFIPLSQRHGNPLKLFWTWNSPNWEFATMFVGIIPITIFGGSFLSTATGVLLGGFLGSCIVGFLSTWGPKYGVPQMIHSRMAFGYRWNFFPAILNAVAAGIGWLAVNSISGAFALNALTYIPFQTSLIIVVLIQTIVAFIGHNFIHQFEKYTLPVLALIFTVSSLIILSHANFFQAFNPGAPVTFGGPIAALIIAFAIAIAYTCGWATYAMDYTRYLPEKSNARHVFWAVTLGIFIPCAILQIAGAGLATAAGTRWGSSDNPTSQLLKVLPLSLGQATLLAIALGGISANALNIYTGSMSFISTGIRLGKLKWQRASGIILFGFIGYLVARLGEKDAGQSYENFLLILGYWIFPFLGVIIVDYLLRKGHYNQDIFYDKTYNPIKGLLAMILGLAASIPFWNQTLWHGIVIDIFPQSGDLSFIVGFLVSSIAYYLLKTRLK